MPQTNSGYVDVVSLANCTAFLPSGEQLKIGRLWQKQTVVLIFLRHFACMACRAHASQVWNEREKYEKTGAKVIFIGNGQPSFINHFKEDMGMNQAMILTDPTLESFRAAGLKRGVLALVQPRSLLNAAKLHSQGHRQSKHTTEAGVHLQLGGVLAINSRSQVLYHFRSESFGDLPDEPHIDIIHADEAKAVS